ncbi:uncharacterized protein LOC133908902 isoform X2 [Phragmites australis]|uniref:uncharacterized protein LOC133908902 isoform X2 n=1 Tax=Phragmites australis TaxID=29695 RepID=UPI002D792920|nr:uncharacterized protein LOC133908902 isoform X2 [Phragmites australis]
MDLLRREVDRSAAPEFVALDIRDEAESPDANADQMMESSLVGKALERERSGDGGNPPSTVTEDHRFEEEGKRNSNGLLLLFMRDTVHGRGHVCAEYGTVVHFRYTVYQIRCFSVIFSK